MAGNMGDMMKEAESLQRNMQKVQEEIGFMQVIGEAGGGGVKITMTGKHEVKRVQIDPSLIGDDHEMLEDLIATATNAAVRSIEIQSQRKMSEVMSGMRLPPGLKLRF